MKAPSYPNGRPYCHIAPLCKIVGNSRGAEGKFLRYECRSTPRSRAERLLAEWDEKPSREPNSSDQKYYYLGTVSGTLNLPQPPQPDDSQLCLYLIPGDKVSDDWYTDVPVHRLTAHFSKYSFHHCPWPGCSLPFRIQGITPGTYSIRAVWDRAKPFNFGDDYIKGPLQPGDYQSMDAPTITVNAGEKLENINIDCTNEVTNGTD